MLLRSEPDTATVHHVATRESDKSMYVSCCVQTWAAGDSHAECTSAGHTLCHCTTAFACGVDFSPQLLRQRLHLQRLGLR